MHDRRLSLLPEKCTVDFSMQRWTTQWNFDEFFRPGSAMQRTIVGCFILAFLHAGQAVGADLNASTTAQVQSVPSTRWEYSVTPYFWATGLSGKVAQFGSPVIDIDSSFDKLFDDLEFGAMLIADARKGRYSVFGDLIYTKIGSDGSTPRGILAHSADVKTSTFAGFIGAGYSVLENPDHRLDVVAGLRLWSVDTDITLKGSVLNGTKRSDSATWVDGLVGLRGNYSFTPKLYATGWGLIGAGGADIDWDVGVGIGYNFNERIAATVGYRALGVDYRQGAYVFDVVQQGPMAGLTIRF